MLLDHVLPPHIPPAHHLDVRFLSSEDGHIRVTKVQNEPQNGTEMTRRLVIDN
jgi:hypothetical protein